MTSAAAVVWGWSVTGTAWRAARRIAVRVASSGREVCWVEFGHIEGHGPQHVGLQEVGGAGSVLWLKPGSLQCGQQAFAGRESVGTVEGRGQQQLNGAGVGQECRSQPTTCVVWLWPYGSMD
jgi:hypothetical protein